MKRKLQKELDAKMYVGLKDYLDFKTDCRIPIRAYFEITTKCNFRCFHCYLAPACFRYKKNEMTTAEIFSVIDQLADMGTMHLELTGGEPLIHPDFWKIIKYARKREFSIIFHTNASLVTEDVAKRLADLYLHSVNIGIYGMSEHIYKKVTGASGAFRKVMNGVKSLVKNGARVDLQALLFRENFFQLKEFMKSKETYGVDQFKIVWGLQHCLDRSETPFRHQLTESQIEEYYRVYPKGLKELVTTKKVFHHASDLLCRTSRNCLTILSDGVVTPCEGIPTNANIRKKSLKEIFKKDTVFKHLRSLRFKDAPRECINCKDLELCGICPQVTHSFTGNMASKHITKSMCSVAKIKRRIINKLPSK